MGQLSRHNASIEKYPFVPEIVADSVEVLLVHHDLADGAVEGGRVHVVEDILPKGLKSIT